MFGYVIKYLVRLDRIVQVCWEMSLYLYFSVGISTFIVHNRNENVSYFPPLHWNFTTKDFKQIFQMKTYSITNIYMIWNVLLVGRLAGDGSGVKLSNSETCGGIELAKLARVQGSYFLNSIFLFDGKAYITFSR